MVFGLVFRIEEVTYASFHQMASPREKMYNFAHACFKIVTKKFYFWYCILK